MQVMVALIGELLLFRDQAMVASGQLWCYICIEKTKTKWRSKAVHTFEALAYACTTAPTFGAATTPHLGCGGFASGPFCIAPHLSLPSTRSGAAEAVPFAFGH